MEVCKKNNINLEINKNIEGLPQIKEKLQIYWFLFYFDC